MPRFAATLFAALLGLASPALAVTETLTAGAGGHFDPRLVDVFLGCEKEFDAIARMTR